MDPDDIEYRKSVRNTIVVLAILVLVVAAALVVSPYVNPPPNTFQKRVSAPTANGFTFTLEVNDTSYSATGYLTISAWVNSTSRSTNNVTGANSWQLDRTRLRTGRPCSGGWPIGIGVMQGHYTGENYSNGILVPMYTFADCPPQLNLAPNWFEFEPAPHSSRALVTQGGTLEIWVIQSSVTFGQGSITKGWLPAGVYTALAADEWGDLLLTNFRVV